MNVIHHSNCPVCGSNKVSAVLEAKDETVSKQLFQIWECAACSARFTQDIPAVADIAAFYKSDAYISHSDISKGLVNKLYHAARAFTLRSKKRLVQKTTGLRTGQLLDVGAGTGAFAAFMNDGNWNVTALEPDATARANAQKNFNILLKPSETIFSLEPAAFDVITLWHVLEHVHELHKYLDIFYSLLKETGYLIIALPNYTSYDATVYSGAWAAYDVPRHLYHLSPKSMKHLLHRHNFKIISHKPMWLDSFYISLLSEKYLTGKGRPLKALVTGVISNLHALRKIDKCSSIIYIAKK